MTLRDPQSDLPTGVRGGSDTWDTEAGTLLAGEFFDAEPAGFSSHVLLAPFGFGVAASASLDLVQASAIGVSGALSASGTLGFKLNITASTLAVSGTASLAGDVQSTLPTLNLAQSGALAVAGAMTAAGTLGLKLTIEASPVSVAGAFSVTGDLAYRLPIDLTASPLAMAGVMGVSGDVLATVPAQGFRSALTLWPYGFGVNTGTASLDLVPTAAISVAGAVSASGDVQPVIEWSFEPPLSVATIGGQLGAAGDLQFLIASLNLAQTSPVAMAGAAALSGDVFARLPLNIAQTAAVAVSGAVAASGDVASAGGRDIAQTAPVGISGALAATGAIQITGPVLLDLAQTAPLGMAGAVVAAGNIVVGLPFNLGATSSLSMGGALGLGGNVGIGDQFTRAPDGSGYQRAARQQERPASAATTRPGSGNSRRPAN